MSRISQLFVFIGITLFANQVSAHGHLSSPTPRFEDDTTLNAPVSFFGQGAVCKNVPASPDSLKTTLTAGSKFNMAWELTPPHPGDCFAYLSYDVNVPDTQKKWFKIADFANCNNAANQQPNQVDLPSYLPSCDHCILRWEWYALHLNSGPSRSVEFYARCADVKIIGNSNGVLPSPQYTIPGHLPMDAYQYRDPYNDEFEKVVGPPVATLNGSPYSCQATYGKSCANTSVSTPSQPPASVGTTASYVYNYPSTTASSSRPVSTTSKVISAPASTSSAPQSVTSASVPIQKPSSTSSVPSKPSTSSSPTPISVNPDSNPNANSNPASPSTTTSSKPISAPASTTASNSPRPVTPASGTQPSSPSS